MVRGPISDQKENQFSSLRVGPTNILVSASGIPQLSLEALVVVKLELPGRYTCNGP